MKESEVKEIFSEIVALIKESDSLSGQVMKIMNDKDEKKPVPFNKIYAQSVEMREKISWHADYGTFPSSLFEKLAPSQTEEERDYIRDTYEQNTLPVWAKGTGVINRIFNEQNYSLTFNDDDSTFKNEGAQKYFREDYPIGGDIIKYWSEIYATEKIKDPNAVAVLRPYKIYEDDARLKEPIVHIFGAKQVMKYVKEEFALVLTDEKSRVTVNRKSELSGLVYELYDDQYIWRITQIGEKKDLIFEIEIWFEHGLGYLPATKLKGEPIQIEDETLYKSYFYNAVPLLNQVLYDSSILQISKVSHVFLEKWEMFEKCTFKDNSGNVCDAGTILHDGNFEKCPSCNGTGREDASGVLKTKFIKMPDRLVDGEFVSPPYAGYIDRPIDILSFLVKNIEENRVNAFLNLNIDISDQANGQTATEKRLDREELFNFLLKFSNEVWGDLDFFLYAIGDVRYINRYKGHNLTEPREFSIRSVAELTEELKSDVPSIAKREINNEILQTRFSTETDTVRIEKLKQTIDRLYDLDNLIIQARKSIGAIATWEVILHDGFYSFVQLEMRKDKNFLDKDLEVKISLLEERAKAKASELEQNKPGSKEDVLNKIANGAN